MTQKRRWLGIAFAVAVLATPVPSAGSMAVDATALHETEVNELQAKLDESGALGMYLDAETGQHVVVVPSAGGSSFALSDVSELNVSIRVESRDIDLLTIERIGQRLEAIRPDLKDFSYGFGFEPETGKVRLDSEAPESAFAAIIGEFPDKISFHRGKFFLTSMSNDPEPHKGGASTSGGGHGCTSGYTHRRGSGQVVMIEAGHCFANNVTTNMGTVENVATVFPYWDVELIEGHSYAGFIYRSATQQQPVEDAFNPAVGLQYCTTGMSTGVKCDWTVTRLNMTICYTQDYPSGACAHNLAEFHTSDGDPIIDGDSGGPLWRKYTNPYRAGIRGIISGVFWNWETLQWRNYATQYSTIASIYGGSAIQQ